MFLSFFRYVVPYNNMLLKQYQVHMNIEWCNQLGWINNINKITTVMKLSTFTIVVIFLLMRHAGYFLGMIFIIEHLRLKGRRFTLKTNNLLC
uniref:Uncharacterized protein n=1 Tax=Lactuca sativa TaxID=4236 RepID=A0A9R1VH19_LACSA|nr:hypothetical protein LSAT_V11C500296750 [Lactuca sativa]